MWLAHELFRDRRVTLVTGLLAAVYPSRLILSVVPLTEIFFILFVLVAMALLWRWMKGGNLATAVGSALCLAAASTIRYEGWVFATCFVGAATARILRARGRHSMLLLAVLAFVALLFPAYRILESSVSEYGLVEVLRRTGESYADEIHAAGPLVLFRNSVAGQFLRQNAVTLNLAGILTLAPLLRTMPAMRSWFTTPALAWLIMSLVTLSGRGVPNHTFWRIAAVWGVLLLPFTACWAWNQGAALLPWKRTGRVLAVLVILLAFVLQTDDLARRSSLTRADLAAGQLLRERLGPETRPEVLHRVLIDSRSWSYLHVTITSGHPFAFDFNTGDNPTQPTAALIDASTGLDADALRARNVRYLVMRAPELIAACDTASGVRRIDRFDYWSVYELTEPP